MQETFTMVLDSLGTSPVTQFSHFSGGPLTAVTSNHQLYTLNGQHWSQIKTPDSMSLTAAAFRGPREGVVIGTTNGGSGDSEGNGLVLAIIVLVVLLAILGGLIYGIIRVIRRKQWKVLSVIGISFIAIIALFLHFVELNPDSSEGFHFRAKTHYVSTAGQSGNVVALTTDGGAHWRRLSLGTNFILTSCAPVDSAYLVTTYANEEHLDGDIWRVPLDPADQPGMFAAARALWGIAETGNSVFVYGTDISVDHIGNPWQSVRGEVLRTNTRLDRVTVLQLASVGGIISLDAAPGSEGFWAVAKDHTLKKYLSGKVAIVPFVSGSVPWRIVCLSQTNVAVLDTDDHVYLTRDGGSSWQPLSVPDSAGIKAIGRVDTELYLGDERGRVVRVTLE